MAFVLGAMGDRLDAILDVTLAYPGARPTLADLMGDRVAEVRVHVRLRPIPADLLDGDYATDRAYRVRAQAWINGLWAEKDAVMDALLSATARNEGQ